ncbi:ABC-type antimicrobial peptide transport system, permease component [Actinacidiphila alni]|uniref:ABC-type antimicrobial peptide transport system, permease component n=1 Tax=Actinacidiphila alni TaxID=380248 RepID=A0A1I2J488_9ACTN|nr:ABC transporter permease [Actinacidiphila alni]SFF49209.1 ABC-type antimicrobial peptide transport system, permease component [Actinacidiphila alni]
MTGFVLLRVRAHRLLLTAALLTVVLTTSVLATFTAFTSAIGDAALRRTLQHQAAGRSTVEVQANVTPENRQGLDSAVRKTVAGAFAGLPATVRSSTRSGPYGLPLALRPAGSPKSSDPDLTLLATFDRSRVTLTEGSWPAPAAKGAAEVAVAVPVTAAQALKVRTGSVITLTNRLGGAPLHIRVTGLYRPVDASAPYWHLDPLDGRGIHTLAFTTYGPMLVDDGTFGSGRVTAAEMSWQGTADFRGASTSRMDALEAGTRDAVAELQNAQATADAQVSSGLPSLLDALRRSLLVTRSTLLIGALQLIILAGFALLLVAQLLAEERAGETSLLRARGGSRSRVARLAAGEALLLAVPAALVAPLLAGPVTRFLSGTGAMARTGVTLNSGSDGAAWLVAVCAALACAFAVIVPALRGGGSYAAERSARSRRGALPGALQAGADIGLLVIAGVAYWQLHRKASGSGALTSGTGGGLGVDPVLVAAPALCLLAGTVLVLRLLPLAAKLGERRAARGSGLALALAGWQFARRPRRGASAVLLLVLAVAMGMFAIGQGASWDRSQHDQADFTVGADIRVTGMTTPPFGQAGIYAKVPGITAAAPAARDELLLTEQRHATVLAIDTRQAADAMRFRSDLTDGRPVGDLLAPLRDGQQGASAETGGYTVPGDASAVEFTASLTALDGGGKPTASTFGPDHLIAILKDAKGVAYQFAIGDLPPDGAPHRLTLDLSSAEGTAGGAPAGPLRLMRIDVGYALYAKDESHRLTIASARTIGPDGAATPLAAEKGGAGAWDVQPSFDDPAYANSPDTKHPVVKPLVMGGPALMSLDYRTGSTYVDPDSYGGGPAVTFRMRVKTPPLTVLPAIATDSYLKAVGAKVGSSVQVLLNGVEATVRITGSVHAVPGTTDQGASDTTASTTSTQEAQDAEKKDAGALVLDLDSVNRFLEAQDSLAMQPSEWWLATAPGASAKVAAALRDRTDIDAMLVRDETARDLRADPLGAGPQSALPAAVVAAAVLAAVGFAVSSVGAIRERATEFAVLRALGAPRRKLARMIAAEQGLLVLISLVVGVVLGALLTRLVTPLIVLTSQAAQPVPKLLVKLPAGPLAQLLGVVLIAPLIVVLATAVRRGDPATALRRQGED